MHLLKNSSSEQDLLLPIGGSNNVIWTFIVRLISIINRVYKAQLYVNMLNSCRSTDTARSYIRRHRYGGVATGDRLLQTGNV